MHLAAARLVGLGPFDDTTFRFGDAMGVPRKTTVVLGGGGVGKTTLLAALASTRPGYAVAQRARRSGEPSFAVTEWGLGADDPARPHTLRVTSPNALLAEAEDLSVLHRREQALFDRKAHDGGFALVAFSGGRWFSRAPLLLGGPDRVLERHDPKAVAVFDDPTRADLAREAKQALVMPLLVAAVARTTPWASVEGGAKGDSLERAVRAAVGPLARLSGHTYLGAAPATFEPMFERSTGGPLVAFDDLPVQARNLIAMPALAVRALHAAWPKADAREVEGVVLVDDAELHLDAGARRGLLPALREALPNVQWLVATSSPEVASACDAGEVLALRRMEGSSQVEVHEGELAVLH